MRKKPKASTQRLRTLIQAHADCQMAESLRTERLLSDLLRAHRADQDKWT